MLKARILVVDDEEQMLELFVRKLQRLSHNVFKARSGKEALEILDSTKIDVIVTDFKMHGMNGIELINNAIERDPTIRSIIVTGCLDTEIADKATKIGVFGCLEKPIDFSELGIAIEKCMQKRHYV
jgi:DNA-binding NtrC family response regulator